MKFYTLQDAHWIDLGVSQSDNVSAEIADVSETERKRREAVWELFRSECVFLMDHLMVLKHVSVLPKLVSVSLTLKPLSALCGSVINSVFWT